MVMPMRALLLIALAGGLASCAPDYEDVPTKLVGVGYNPDEIGPSPTPYGGVVEYSWVNFSGGGLSLALMGLGSFDEVGPGLVGYKPPYAAVYGFSYVFDTKLASADSLGGVTSVPPDVDDTCYTTFAAGGPIGSFKTVDIGSWLEFRGTEADDAGFRLDRFPKDYPGNPQDAFVYYIGIDFWTKQSTSGLVQTDDSNDPDDLSEVVVRSRNFPFGEEVEFAFPGALTPVEVPVASMPLPSSAVDGGNARYTLPSDPGGVVMSWKGPQFDSYGREIGAGTIATCLSFAAPGAAPVDPSDCEGFDPGNEPVGQTYTGPWNTEEGVTFRWNQGENPDEYVSLAVRFLGPVDRSDPSFAERVVKVTADGPAERAWEAAQDDGLIPPDAAVPEGRRAPTACEEGEWVFDDAYENAVGGYVPAMQGNPLDNVAEVTCRLADDGEYTLTAAQLEEAITYARRVGAEGAVFYFARSTETEARVPAVKNQFDQRLEISPIKLTSRAVDIGRFWFDPEAVE
jgi:hypothetical protein